MSCLIMTPQIKEIAKSLNMNPEECKDWIGYWQEQTGTNLEAYPTPKELKGFIDREMASIPSQKEIDEHLANLERHLSEEEDWDWTYDDDRVSRVLEDARMTFQEAEASGDKNLINRAAHNLTELTKRVGMTTSELTPIDLIAYNIVQRESVLFEKIPYEGEPELLENVKTENFPYFTGEEKVASLEKGGYLGRDIEYDKDKNIIGWVNKNSVVAQFENPAKTINGIALAVVQDSETDEYGRIHFHKGGQKAALLYDYDTSRINHIFREGDTFGTQKPNSTYMIAAINEIEDATSKTSSYPRITVSFYSGNAVTASPDNVQVFTMEQFYHLLNNDKLYPLSNVAERDFKKQQEAKQKRQASSTRERNLYDNIAKTPEGRKLIEQVPNIAITANRPGEGTISKPYRAKMSFEFNGEKRPTVKGNTTLEAVQNGQRIATTRYKSDGHLDYWKQMKRGDVIEFSDNDGNSEFVVVINPLTQLTDTSHKAAQSWSNKEGWSMARFNRKVKEKIQDPNDEAWQIEFLPLDLVMALQDDLGAALVSPTTQHSQLPQTQSAQQAQQAQQKPAQSPTNKNKGKFVAPKYNRGKFDTRVNPISEQTRNKVNEMFKGNIQKKKDRTVLIAALFSDKVSLILDAEIENYNNAIDNAEDTKTKEKIQRQLEKLNKFYAIKKVTPKNIFLEIYNELKDYADRKGAEYGDVVVDYDNDVDDEELREARVQAFKEITDDFDVFIALAEDACRILRVREGVDIDTQSLDAQEVTNTAEGQYQDDIESMDTQVDDEPVDDRVIKEGWGENVKNLSSKDSLSQKTRQLISLIPRADADGEIDYDDIGFARYLDADEVHTTLNNILMNMTEPADMIPMMENYAKNNPWITKLIEMLKQDGEEDGTVSAQFYTDFRKNFLNYGIQLWQQTTSGTVNIKTKNINQVEGVRHLLNKWRNNYEGKKILNKELSIYDNEGRVDSQKSKENATKGKQAITAILQRVGTVERNTEFSNIVPALLELLQDKDIQRNIITLCQMIGINTAPETIIKALSYSVLVDSTDEKGNKIQLPTYPPIKEFLHDINTILTGVEKGKIQDTENEDGTVSQGDVIEEYKFAFTHIASVIAKVYNKTAVESSSRENGKSYYSHIVPNYLTDLIKTLKNAKGLSEKEYLNYLEEEFGKYEWFKRGDTWLNDWLEELARNPQAREQLDHVEDLHFGNVEYSQLSDLQYTVGLMARYWANPNQDYAWYHVPIMSNAQSAEFIKFKREHGTYWKDKLLTKFVNVVSQEYNRIKLVAQRNEEQGTREIGNFDKRGLEFCFFPAFNDKSKFSYPVLDGLGNQQVSIEGQLETRSFLEQLDYLYRNDKTQVEDFVKGELEKLIDEEFEKAFKDWHKNGLFGLSTSPEGLKEIKYRYLPYSFTPSSIVSVLDGLVGNDKMKGAKDYLQAVETVEGELWTPQMEEAVKVLKNIGISPAYYDYNKLQEALSAVREAMEKASNLMNISKSDFDFITARLAFKDSTRNGLMEYFYNSMFATSQIIQLTTTDLAFYKNLADFQKRFKEVHSPAMRLNTLAKFNGELIGREFEKTIYLKDEEIISTLIDAFKDLLAKQHQEGQISDYTYASMMAKYGASNHEVETDKFVEKIDPKTGEKTLVPQKIKYFKVTGKDPKTGKPKDTLVKTSKVNVTDAQAYRSLSSYRAVSGMVGEWTQDKEDAYQSILDGSYRSRSLHTTFHTLKPFAYAQVAQIVGYENGPNGESLPIWQKIPVQHKNSELLILTAYKAVAGELANSADPNSKVARAVNKLKVINAFMEANGIDVVQFESAVKVGNQGVIDINEATSEDEIEQILNKATKMESGGDPTVVHTIPYSNYGIQQATPDHFLDTNQVVGTQLRRLITSDIDPKAKFKVGDKVYSKASWLKLYNALINQNVKEDYEKVQEELSDNKKVERILQRQLKSSQRYALELLKAVTLNENGDFVVPLFEPSQARRTQELLTSVIKNAVSRQKTKGGSFVQASEYGLSSDLQVKFKNDDAAQGIEYIECYLPATSEALFKAYAKKDGSIDLDKVPDELKKLIGYRVPTEDKYSMLPLKIKGFLPQENGGVIMLPAEITTIAGSDFDIDKVFFMQKSFNIIRDEEDNIISLEEIKYNMDAAPDAKENTREARDNMIFDLMWAQLTHPDTVTKLLNPGGFDAQKISSRICTILSIHDRQSLIKALSDNIKDFDIKAVPTEKALIQYLFNLDIPTLDSIVASSQEELNPLSPRTQVILQQQNMNGANLVGIYANHNASHAIMQQTQLALSSAGSFQFNGKILTSLHSIKNEEGDYISRNTAGYLALSVDDTKERLLYGINQNTFTADVTMLLSRLGYNPTEIGILLNQPIIKEMTSRYFNRNGKTKAEVIDAVIAKFQELAGLKNKQFDYKDFKNSKFEVESLAGNILQSHLESKPKTYYADQMAVGYLFKQMMKTAGALTDLVNITKIDSSKNGAGPTVADMEEKIYKVLTFNEALVKRGKNFPLSGANIILPSLTDEEVQNSLIPAVQTFFTYGIERPLKILERFFPFASPEFKGVCNALAAETRRGELSAATRNSIYNDFIAYVLSNLSVFKGEDALETRRQFVHHFTDYFWGVVRNPKNAEELKNNRFIQDLSERAAKRGSSLRVITMQLAGSLTSTLRDSYMADWESLLYSENPAIRELAVNLGRYCFFRSGMAFGSTSFAHLMPVTVRMAIPEYLNALREMVNPLRSDFDWKPFISQYVRNHLDNKQIVTSISPQASFKFTQNGKILDNIVIKISESSSDADKKVVISMPDDVDPYATVVRYISAKVNGITVYYERDESAGDVAGYGIGEGDSTLVYFKRITPLGMNAFLEYEYGKNADEVQSAVPYIWEEETNENSDIVNTESQDFMEQPEDDRLDTGYAIPNTIQAQDELMRTAFNDVFGETLDYVESIPQETAFSPSDIGIPEYTDAEDNIIC